MMNVRIGNASGYYGDRMSAMHEMLTGGQLDYLTGDYLTELTLLALRRDQARDSDTGYAKTFLRQLRDCLEIAVDNGVRIISNAGGVNPAGLAAALRRLAAEHDLPARIAYVDGDDLLPWAQQLGLGEPLTANAYLGAFGIVDALRAGADVVVTGRVTDASLVVGPAAAHHFWTHNDVDALAGATVAGHVLERGTQASGGNFPGLETLPLRSASERRFGFPIAEIAMNGSSVITKHPGTGGAVTLDTVTAQLVSGIESPHYRGPDVVARLETVRIAEEAPDRVSISGVRGLRPPPDVRVGVTRLGGYRNSAELLLTGLDIESKARLLRAQLTDAFGAEAPERIDWELDRGVAEDPETQAAATARLRCQVRSATRELVGLRFSRAIVELAQGSYAGFSVHRPPSNATPYAVFSSAYVSQSVPAHSTVRPDGTRCPIPVPTRFCDPDELAYPTVERGAEPHHGGATVRAPLGRIAHARSSDTGSDVTLGVWVPAAHPRRAEAYAWLRSLLDVATVRRLLPEAKDLDVEVYALANLCALSLVLRGLLDDGVAGSPRIDPQGNAVGEWVRARQVELPAELLSPI